MEVPEVLHEVWPNLFALRFDRPIKIVSSIGLLFVVLGVAGELSFEHWRSGYEGLLQDFENTLLLDAERHAASAQQEAGDAGDSATKAAAASDRASGAASNALGLATGARKEADSFAKDIKLAKQQAADAVSRLADAEQRLADATQNEAEALAALRAIKTPRSISSPDDAVAALKPFSGTAYTLSAFQDDESFSLLKGLVGILHDAGWVLSQPKQVPITSLFLPLLNNPRVGIPACFATGISIDLHVENPNSFAGKDPNTYPGDLRGAIALEAILASEVFPKDAKNIDPGVVDRSPGNGPMNICIGKKP